MIKFVNENNIKSTSDYLIVTDLRNKYTYIFKKDNGGWGQLYKWQCTIGKPETPTITGIFYISGRKPSLERMSIQLSMLLELKVDITIILYYMIQQEVI